MAKILLVEDDESIAEAIVDFLKFDGHEVEHLGDGQEALLRLKISSFDLIVLDWNLPHTTGIEVLTEYRGNNGKTPVLMLTAKSEVVFRSQGLDQGADDYLTKPFDMRELGSRVRALLRRPLQTISTVLKAGPLSVDIQQKKCELNGEELRLLNKEFAVLEFLMRQPGRVCNTDELLRNVWRSDTESGPDAVRQCIARLRKKLNREGQPQILATVIGSGYRIEST